MRGRRVAPEWSLPLFAAIGSVGGLALAYLSPWYVAVLLPFTYLAMSLHVFRQARSFVADVQRTSAEVRRIIDSYTLTMVGAGAEEYVEACADDVLSALGWPILSDASS